MNGNPAQSKTDEKLRAFHSRAGFASTAMLCAVVLLLGIGADVLSPGLHRRGLAVRALYVIPARYPADAGLIKAFFEINEKLKVIP